MSEFNFKVGDKICNEEWEKGQYQIITAIGKGMFLVWDEETENEICHYSGVRWLPYEEPEPEFDWKADGFWGTFKDGGDKRWFAKSSKWVWHAVDKIDGVYGGFAKTQIIKEYKPCSPPPWANKIDPAYDPDFEVEEEGE